MAFLERDQLERMGFKHLGRNVRIGDKAAVYNPELVEIGDESRIDDFCVVSGKVTLGRNVHIAVFCNLAGGSEGIVIEDFAGCAYGCQLFSQSDDYSGRSLTNPTVPARFKRETKKKIHVGRHCILGTGAIVFPGVTLAEGTSVGATAVVTRSTEEWSIYVGNPARRLKARRRDLLELERAYLAAEGETHASA
ncbi:MAG TPA: hypothetical protein VGW40_01700 [Allosphingosinicella sp.]|nr:hypothetical protein [Allosphingosinicella sp.]